MRQFGLIGKTLKHSFSKKFFAEKFEKEKIEDCQYDLFELANISEFPKLVNQYENQLHGINVTIPYKKEVIQFLDELEENANAIQAINTIKILPNGKLKGYNTDYYGFMTALKEGWDLSDKNALVLGTGGASLAIKKALADLGISFQSVSRNPGNDCITYKALHVEDWLQKHELIINTTPLGTYPAEGEKPDLPYHQLTSQHLLFDLVYNPEMTSFMKEGVKRNAQVKNGYKMLVGQAEASWKIWNEK